STITASSTEGPSSREPSGDVRWGRSTDRNRRRRERSDEHGPRRCSYRRRTARPLRRGAYAPGWRAATRLRTSDVVLEGNARGHEAAFKHERDQHDRADGTTVARALRGSHGRAGGVARAVE